MIDILIQNSWPKYVKIRKNWSILLHTIKYEVNYFLVNVFSYEVSHRLGVATERFFHQV